MFFKTFLRILDLLLYVLQSVLFSEREMWFYFCAFILVINRRYLTGCWVGSRVITVSYGDDCRA